jgi:hypothetical protein
MIVGQWLMVTGLAIGLAGCGLPQLSQDSPLPAEGWPSGDSGLVQPVAPGDVLYLTTLMRGVAPGTGNPGPRNALPPWWDTHRIPLRHARTILTPNEAALLISFLATNARQYPLSEAQSQLDVAQVTLWNLLVDHLVLFKSTAEQPPQLAVKTADFCGESDLPKVVKAHFLDCDQTLQELRRIGALGSTLAPVTIPRGNLGSGAADDPYRFYQGNQVGVSSAQLERHSASMRNLLGDEARWSLADWESSGICVDKDSRVLRIRAIYLRDQPWRPLRVLPSNSDQKAKWRVSLQPDGHRAILATPDDEHPEPETISLDSLPMLFPADVSALDWDLEDPGNQDSSSADLAPLAQTACRP